jgi:phospholipid/cholesterol/gamma-HCH transport system permease protein
MGAMKIASLSLQEQGADWLMQLSGDWSLSAAPQIQAQLDRLPAEPTAAQHGGVTCDWSDADSPGIGSAWMLLTRLIDLGFAPPAIKHVGAPPHYLDLLQKLGNERHAARAQHSSATTLEEVVGGLGYWAVLQGRHARGVVDFFGRIVMVVGQAFPRPAALRPSSLVRHMYETGITAIPIVSLIAFLISVIVAYLGAQQLSRFGADIFVVDLVTIAVLREMGVLLTAIIVAGRSGSAFAAEIGVMQLNEETDALRAMGINPIEVLVLPRVLALLLVLPGLTVIADAMGLAGGCLLSLVNLHIPLPQFISRMQESLAPTTFWSGLIKAPVFALLIAVIGTFRGMEVRNSARELGRLTTVAVVQSIFFVILADALFAILFVQIDF